MDSDAVTEALLSYANTKCRVLGKSPAELAFGRTLKDFFPRQVSSLLPIPENLMTGQVKDILQEKIRKAGGAKWSEHTRVLPPLELGQWVQLQNLKGRYPLKSDNSGIIVGKHNENKAKAISAELLKLNLKIKMEERGKTRCNGKKWEEKKETG